MLIRLVKQIWLVMLVVFAIGWSSVSVASANTMHLVMPSEKTNPHCLEMTKPSASHSLHKTDHPQDQELIQPDCVSDSSHQIVWIVALWPARTWSPAYPLQRPS